jgi:hypothetical protein
MSNSAGVYGEIPGVVARQEIQVTADLFSKIQFAPRLKTWLNFSPKGPPFALIPDGSECK